jgi:hypothetical protein
LENIQDCGQNFSFVSRRSRRDRNLAIVLKFASSESWDFFAMKIANFETDAKNVIRNGG